MFSHVTVSVITSSTSAPTVVEATPVLPDPVTRTGRARPDMHHWHSNTHNKRSDTDRHKCRDHSGHNASDTVGVQKRRYLVEVNVVAVEVVRDVTGLGAQPGRKRLVRNHTRETHTLSFSLKHLWKCHIHTWSCIFGCDMYEARKEKSPSVAMRSRASV